MAKNKCSSKKEAARKCKYYGVKDAKTGKRRRCKNYVTHQASGCYVCDCHLSFAGGAGKKRGRNGNSKSRRSSPRKGKKGAHVDTRTQKQRMKRGRDRSSRDSPRVRPPTGSGEAHYEPGMPYLPHPGEDAPTPKGFSSVFLG